MSRNSLDGRWHLIAAECPDDEIPQHRVDLAFHDEQSGLRGAIVSRADGSEMPLESIAFDGQELRLRMAAAPGPCAPTPPFLVMAAVAERFEVGWDLPAMRHIRLKLVRAARLPAPNKQTR